MVSDRQPNTHGILLCLRSCSICLEFRISHLEKRLDSTILRSANALEYHFDDASVDSGEHTL